MRTSYLVLAMVMFFAVSIATGFSQNVPPLISYQGKLLDSVGAPVTGSRQMRFELLDGDTAGSTVLWGETQSGLAVSQGIYSVMLGSQNPIPLSVLNGPSVYLQVKVEGETLSPRQRIASVAYALVTENAANSDKLGGLDSSAFAPAVHDHDDRYYTKPEVDTMIAGAGSGDCYSTAEVDAMIAGLQSQISALQPEVSANTAAVMDLDGRVTANEAGLADHESRIAGVEGKLSHVSVSGTDFNFTGVNVHILNGVGSTETSNGLGNLIVGYNESRGAGDNRNGSHNIVTGSRQNYSSYGGLAAGYWNTISGPYCSVNGGDHNTAGSNSSASVLGGSNNVASGVSASVGGGYSNTASGFYSGVRGGENNTATARSATTSGGLNRSATTAYDWVGGNLTQNQ